MTEAKAREIFELALEKPADQRVAFVERLCGSATELRDRVLALLDAQQDAGEFLSNPTGGGAIAEADRVGEAVGDVIDRYKLLQSIGEGGMGEVWMAEQFEPVRRKVALKVIKLGMDTKQVVGRFEAERQALALMDHPHIAKVLDGGVTRSGRPYFVMELVKGVPITDFCDEAKLALRDRLELFTQVCQAIQHAHQKGIIHRDLKPGNVLVTLHDGTPMVKVIDFGIAKATNQELTQRTLFTEYHQILGTPEYMAPEQAAMSALDVDTRADVYSLGVLLYELLTGTKPFDLKTLLTKGYDEVLRTIREEEPPKPSTRASTADAKVSLARQLRQAELSRRLQGDLDWIVVKAMEKDRTRRYESASEFAADIRRYLVDEAVSAMPPSATYRLRKFVRRNKGMVTAAAVVALALSLGLAGTAWGWRYALGEKRRAEKAEKETSRELARAIEVQKIITEMITGITPQDARGADTTLLRQIVDRTARRLTTGEIVDERVAASLHGVLAYAYVALFEADEAERHNAAAKRIHLRLSGPGSLPLARIRSREASILWQRGKIREAHALLTEVGPDLERLSSEDDAFVIGARVNLFNLMQVLGQHAEMLKLVPSVLERARRALGDSHEFVFAIELCQVESLGRVGRYEEAIAIAKQTHAGMVAEYGPDHPRTLSALGVVGRCHRWVGNHDEATRCRTESLQGLRRVAGEEHDQTMFASLELIDAYLDSWQLAKARELYEHVAPIVERRMSPTHPRTFELALRHGRLLRYEGRHDDTVALLKRTAARARRILATDKVRALQLAYFCADGLYEIERYADAFEVLHPVHGEFDDVWGRDHLYALRARTILADCASEIGKLDMAEPMIVQAHSDLLRVVGRTHERTRLARRVLARVHARRGRHKQAEKIFLELIEEMSESQGEGIRRYLGMLYADLGRHSEAEQQSRLRIATLKKTTPDDMRIPYEQFRLKDRLIAQNRHADAVEVARAALAFVRRVAGEESPHTPVAVSQCAHAHLVAGQKAEARRLLQKSLARIQATGKAANGRGHERVLRVLADVHRESGRYREAGKAILALFDVQKARGMPRNDVEVVYAAGYFEQADDHASAESLYREARGLRAEKYGKKHILYLQSTISLGGLLYDRRRFKEALPFLIEAVRLEALAPKQAWLLPRERVALTYLALRDFAKSEETLRGLLALSAELSNADNQGYARPTMGLAERWRETGRWAEAALCWRHVVEHGPTGSPIWRDAATFLSAELRAARRVDEAEALERRILAAFRGAENERKSLRARLYLFAGAALRRVKALEEAHQQHMACLTLVRTMKGKQDGLLDEVFEELRLDAFGRQRWGDYEEAAREVLAIRRRTLSAKHPRVLAAMTNLGVALVRQSRFEEARKILEKSLEAKRKALPAGHRWTRAAAVELARAYLGLGRRADALALERELFHRWLAPSNDAKARASTLNRASWRLLTHQYEELQDPARARKLMERAMAIAGVERDPQYFAYLDTLAQALHRTGDTKRAVEMQRRALALAPEKEKPAFRARLEGYESARR